MTAHAVRDGEWQRRAQCRADEYGTYFFAAEAELPADRTARESVARGICGTCPVRQPCLAAALVLEEPFGIWGGLDERQRRRLRRKRHAARA